MEQTNNRQQRIHDLATQISNIVGFGAVAELGYKLNEDEVGDIVEYAEAQGGNPGYVEKVVRGRGRPFSLYDPNFKSECFICHDLRNYCCC
jgi:hypothetical protein